MSLVLLLGCAFFGALQSVSSKLAARCGSEETGFIRTKALAALAPVAAAFLFRPAFHAPTALFGALYGLSLCAAMLFGYSIGEYLGEDLQVAQLKEQMCYTGL